MKAIVYKSTGSWYIVQTEDGQQFNARIKGKLKIGGITSTNPIAVGDLVQIEEEDEVARTMTIVSIDDRRNYITRISPHNKNQHHIIASNMDQTMLFATLKDPITSQGFMDRFLITAEAYHIPAIIVINKCDLHEAPEKERLKELEDMFGRIGYPVLAMSIANQTGVAEVKELLRGKTTLISGHSGVGKSSFINIVLPELGLRTQEVSDWSGKGMHTTTFAEMYNLSFGGRLIDTPGIRELGLVDIPKEELSHFFPEMRELLNNCKYNNCIHMNEPGCAIKIAVQQGQIHVDRYISYCNILEKIEDKTY